MVLGVSSIAHAGMVPAVTILMVIASATLAG